MRSSDSRVDRLRRILLGRARAAVVRRRDAVFCTGFGRRRKVKECLAQEGGAEKEGGEERRARRAVAGDRDRSWAALCRDDGTQRGTLVRWRSLESSLASVRR